MARNTKGTQVHQRAEPSTLHCLQGLPPQRPCGLACHGVLPGFSVRSARGPQETAGRE